MRVITSYKGQNYSVRLVQPVSGTDDFTEYVFEYWAYGGPGEAKPARTVLAVDHSTVWIKKGTDEVYTEVRYAADEGPRLELLSGVKVVF